MIVINSGIVRVLSCVLAFLLIYFFSYQLQQRLAGFFGTIMRKFGGYTNTQELALQRYVFQHSRSLVAIVYGWINRQLIGLGVKKHGVTPLGYFIFWGFASLMLSLLLMYLLHMGLMFTGGIWIVLWVCMLVMTRVIVSEKIEKREMEVMDSIDLLVPELDKGVKNAIITYQDNVPLGVREDFKAFVTNTQDRGFSFEDAMYTLSDGLGAVFKDFAEKAIYYERSGEKDLLDIFSDIVETNRLRRQLREENNRKFRELRITFIVSTLMTFAYFIFIITTDTFSRTFLLQTTAGNVLLLIICIIVFAVLAFITTIKSNTI